MIPDRKTSTLSAPSVPRPEAEVKLSGRHWCVFFLTFVDAIGVVAGALCAHVALCIRWHDVHDRMGLLLLCFLLDLLAALHICSARGVAVAFRERDCCYLRFRVRLLAFLVVANLVLFCLFLLDQIFSTKFLVSKHEPAIPLAFTGFFAVYFRVEYGLAKSFYLALKAAAPKPVVMVRRRL